MSKQYKTDTFIASNISDPELFKRHFAKHCPSFEVHCRGYAAIIVSDHKDINDVTRRCNASGCTGTLCNDDGTSPRPFGAISSQIKGFRLPHDLNLVRFTLDGKDLIYDLPTVTRVLRQRGFSDLEVERAVLACMPEREAEPIQVIIQATAQDPDVTDQGASQTLS